MTKSIPISSIISNSINKHLSHVIQMHTHTYIWSVHDSELHSGLYRQHEHLWTLMDSDLLYAPDGHISLFSLWYFFIIIIPEILPHPHIMLSCWDPHPIAEILSDPRSIPYCSPNSILTNLWDSNAMLTKPLNSNQPLRPLTHYHCSPRTLNNLWEL